MYANLLANSMIPESQKSVHPAFVSIISQLSPFDASLFKDLFHSEQEAIPYATLQVEKCPISQSTALNNECIYFNNYILDTSLSGPDDKVTPSIDNLSRLGVINIRPDITLSPLGKYKFVENSYFFNSAEVKSYLSSSDPNFHNELRVRYGSINLTKFGTTFYDVCVSGIL